MIYCEGKNCSRRDQCAYHELFESKYPRQYLDCSTEGRGHGGIDKMVINFIIIGMLAVIMQSIIGDIKRLVGVKA